MKTKIKPDIEAHYTQAELLEIVNKMKGVSSVFYSLAIHTQNHAFVEFCGLMNKYIGLCERAALAGIDFTQANVHTGHALPVEDHDVKYLAEKFECIFGPTMANLEVRAKFLKAMGWGEKRL